MQKILRVAAREYVESVKTKTFLLGLLMVPVIIVGIVLVSSRISRDKGTARGPIRIAVRCESADLFAKVKASFDQHNLTHSLRPITIEETPGGDGGDGDPGKKKLRQGGVQAYAVVEGDPNGGDYDVRLYTHRPKPAHMDALWTVESLLRRAVVDYRCERRGLDRAMLDKIRCVPIERVELGAASGQEQVQDKGHQVARMMVPFAFMYLIFMGIVTTGQQMLSSIIEEKSSRVIEVLLSAVSPFQLMAGKILGLVGIGLTVVCLWGVAAIGTARWQGLNVGIAPSLLPYFILYYILAFLLFGSTMVGIGSVCNTIKETQSLMTPVMLFCIMPLLAWQNIVQDSNGMLARGLSFFPPTAPMVMILRLSGGSDIWRVEILASIVILAAAVLVAMAMAAKVFRTGILMYGKRPGLMEVARWLKQT